MPELPEVETVVRHLRPDLLGRSVRGLRIHTPSIIRCQMLPMTALVGATIDAVDRRGKFIRIRFRRRGPAGRRVAPAATDLTLLVHLRMTGRLNLLSGRPTASRHDHIDLDLSGRRLLRFSDMRKFGGFWLMDSESADCLPPIAGLGPEPLDMPRDDFRQLLAQHRTRIKALLLDQRRVAGLGNIYCDEALFAARIHPATPTCDVPADRVDELYRHIRRILRDAIHHQGSSTANFVNPRGQRGAYQDRHRVYGRHDTPCPRCGATLRRSIVAGRGTTHCPCCQKP